MSLAHSDVLVREGLVQKIGSLTTSVCGFEHELETASFPGCQERESNMLCGHGELLWSLFSEVVELVLRNDLSLANQLDLLQIRQRELSLQLWAEDNRISNAINDPMGWMFFDQIQPNLSQGKLFQAHRALPFRSWQTDVLLLLNSL